MLSGSPRGMAGKRSHFSRPFRFLLQTHPSLQTISLWHKNNDTFANPRQCKNNFPGPSILFHLIRSLSMFVSDWLCLVELGCLLNVCQCNSHTGASMLASSNDGWNFEAEFLWRFWSWNFVEILSLELEFGWDFEFVQYLGQILRLIFDQLAITMLWHKSSYFAESIRCALGIVWDSHWKWKA